MSRKSNRIPPKSNTQASARPTKGSDGLWLYGHHAVVAALANPERKIMRLVGTQAALEELPPKANIPAPQVMQHGEIGRLVGEGAVHQGIAAQVRPLVPWGIEEILAHPAPSATLLVLDQITDPHNVGAILRSAAAFDVLAVMQPKDHSAPESAAMAKAASGAVDIVPRAIVTNIAQAFRELKTHGWWIIGLEGEAKTPLHRLNFPAKTVLVLGAEGRGMRRLTGDLCDERAHLPIHARMESLNVSNAAAIALYQRMLGTGCS